MTILKSIIICYCALCYLLAFGGLCSDYFAYKRKGYNWHLEFNQYFMILLAPLLPFYFLFDGYVDKFKDVYKHGGFKKYKEWKKQNDKNSLISVEEFIKDGIGGINVRKDK